MLNMVRQLLTALRTSLFTVSSVCIFLVSPSLSAAPFVPPPSPGAVVSPIDKPVYQPERKQTPKIEREDAPKAEPPQSSVKVLVNSFTFKGNTTFSDAALKKIVAEFEGKELSIADIYHVADVVEANYRYKGYLLTSVYLPAQKINSGTIMLEVIEGRLGEIKIEGNISSYSENFLKNQADGLKPGKIISDDELETETLMLGDLPGLDARAVIAPGKEYGTSDVIFITEEKRYSGVLSANNFGRKSIGEKRIEGGLLIANPIFEGDMLNLSGIAAEGSRMLYGRIDYDALINTSGTRAGISYSAFDYEVDTAEVGLPAGSTLGGKGSTIVLRGSHTLQRTSKNNTSVLVNLRRSVTQENGTASLRPKSTINLLETYINWEHFYRDYARTTVSGGLSTNFKTRSSITDTSSQKIKLTLDVNHYQPFWERWFVTGRAQGVYSPDPLVDVERFRIGGQGSVRAYPSAELAGSKGGVLSLDVGSNFIVSDNVVLTPRLFADAGKVYRNDKFGLFGLAASESLAGYGGGLGIVIAKNHAIDLEVAKPTTAKVSSDGRDTRYWLSYRGTF